MVFIPIITPLIAALTTTKTSANTVLRGAGRLSPQNKHGWAVVYQTSVGPVRSKVFGTQEEAQKCADGSSSRTQPRVIRV